MFKIIGGDKKEYGPVTVSEIQAWMREGRCNAQTLAQRISGGEWQPLGSFPEFAQAALPPTLTMPPPSENPPVEVTAPAVLLIIGGGGGILFSAIGLAQHIFGGGLQLSQLHGMPADVPPAFLRFLQYSAGIPANLFSIGLSTVILMGGISLLKRRRRGFVMAAAILGLLCGNPCCCPVGLIGGIWTLVILSKPEADALFE